MITFLFLKEVVLVLQTATVLTSSEIVKKKIF